MDLRLPKKLDLARVPTPLSGLERTSAELGADIWIKRDDLTGLELSGNKVRKLEFLLADALARGADTLITCGGVNSNHARATAVVAAQHGLSSHLLLRGEDRDPPEGNLLLDRLVAAETTFITREQYARRDELMAEIAGRLSERGRTGYVIPEGGSNDLGTLGYALAAEELCRQAHAAGVPIRRVFHATGSGGTTAGLALGMAALDRADVEVVGVAVSDDAAYFDARITRILDDVVKRGIASAKVRAQCRWRILEGYKGNGYAVTTPLEMADHLAFARREGVFVDPVYTGKALRGLMHEARTGRLGEGASVFLHTGGLFELFAYAREIAACLKSVS